MTTFFAYSSLAVASSAGLLSLSYGALSGTIVPARSIVVFLATLASYNFTQLAPMSKHVPLNPRGRWLYENRKKLWKITAASLAAIGPLCFFLSSWDIANFAHLFIITILYENTLGNKPLRKTPFAKPFFISYIWTMCCALPAFYDNAYAGNLWMVPECFLFIFGLCVLFDIRDAVEDLYQGVVTFATNFSLRTAKAIALGSVAASLGILIVKSPVSAPAATLYFAALFLFTWKLKVDSGEFAYLYGVDGFVALKLLLLLAI